MKPQLTPLDVGKILTSSGQNNANSVTGQVEESKGVRKISNPVLSYDPVESPPNAPFA